MQSMTPKTRELWAATLTNRTRRGVAAAAMRREGAETQDVADFLGCKPKRVYDWSADPFGVRNIERKARYRGTCEECGESTYGNKMGDASKLCLRCAQGKPRINRRQRCAPCGSCHQHPKVPGRHVCAECAPAFDRMREEFQSRERADADTYGTHGAVSRASRPALHGRDGGRGFVAIHGGGRKRGARAPLVSQSGRF